MKAYASILAVVALVAVWACADDDVRQGRTGATGGTGGAAAKGGDGGGWGGGTGGDDCAEEEVGVPAPFGLDERPPNPTCIAPPRPRAAAAVVLEPYRPSLRFDQPLLLLQAPGDDARWYVVEKEGRVLTFTEGADPTVFADLRDRIESKPREAGLLGMAFHPQWPARAEVFLSYTSSAGSFHSVIARYAATGTDLDEASEELVLEVPQTHDRHNGGHILFGPDGMLYVGMGDGGQGVSLREDGLLLGKMLRLDVDGARPYAIPPDNPFVDGPLRPEVWATGFRNPWRFSFDEQTGRIWVGDVGASAREEVDVVERGGHHGWNVMEGSVCFEEGCDPAGYVPPVADYGRDEGQSITGGFVYRGAALPELAGAYVYGDFVSGRIWAIYPEDDPPAPKLLVESGMNLASFGRGNDGEIYAIDHLGGGLYRLAAADGGEQRFPGRLSETGCFDPDDPRHPVEGMIPYDVNVPLWSDGTRKARWMAIPDGTTISVEEDGDWTFPPGTVLAKHFAFGCKLVETRLFVHHDDGAWAGYTYEWNPEQTDAFLLADEKTSEIGERTWVYPSRAQCMQCHTAAAGRALGPETAQLDREIFWPTGRRANVVDTLVHIGLIEADPDRSAGPLPAPDGDAHVELRAKSYLHANCSSCHRPGGTGQGAADFRFATPLAAMGICGTEPQSGNLGVEGARLVEPGAPERSIVALRMEALGDGRMPPVGTRIVDPVGIDAVHEWIRWLDACP